MKFASLPYYQDTACHLVLESLMENVSKDFVMKLVQEGKSHEEISEILKATYPSIVRGLSVRSVRRFCSTNDIHRCKDSTLDEIVEECVSEVSAGLWVVQ